MSLHRRHLLSGLASSGLAASGLVASGLAACSARPKASTGKKVSLRMSWWGGSSAHKATLSALKIFMQRYPHIEVTGEYTGFIGHLERLTTQIAGHTAPDLMQINWYWQILFSRDGTGFYDLDRLSHIIDLSQFDPRTLDMGRRGGHLNALSLSNAARLFYFNRTTFDQAGLSLPASWDDLLTAGPKLQAKLGDAYYAMDATFQDFTALGRSYIVQKTGKAMVDDVHKRLNCTPDDMAEMAWLYGRMTGNHGLPSARYRASFGNVAQQELRPWINGQFAGCYLWNSSIDKFTDTLAHGEKLKLAPYPLRPGATDAGLLYRPSMMFAINSRTKYPEETALLLNFLMNDPAGVRAMGLVRGIPDSRIGRATLAADGTITGLKADSEVELAKLPITVTESPWFEHPRVRDGFQDILEMQGYGVLSEKEAGQRLYDDINAILARVIR
ncbi:ABC transporter substrate-binding protein [Asticcacaulis sp. EMRT-3]|uniref:ABC transporter substrate-binding protein n=1 Tax=Asticcacaulis sp. EMRT-3 TaxID=3040349 RepID=UPI0024AE8BA5|nr:ABC transporter substrate-binding protein [Asticcacaulis sp. EMRT-3]MDI7776483.1 ABC transporter substrate-binding protein [Asticcacaulis sp. EMRT-3]